MDPKRSHELVDPVMVAPRLAALREALGLNKTDFAARIGIDKSSYTKIEKGEKPLLVGSAYRIYQLYGVDLNYIYMGQVRDLPGSLSNAIISRLSNPTEAS